MRIDVSKTELNLWTSFMDEAKTHRLYSAYALAALSEGYPEVAEAFMQAAGDEIIHATMHLRALGAVKSTAENLRQVVEHEAAESAVTYPRYIAEAKAEGRTDALVGFEVAMAREQAHVKLFQDALALVERRGPAAPSGMERSNVFDRSEKPADGAAATAPRALERTARGVEKMTGPAEITEERERVASRTRIREFVFGAQDGLLTTVSVVSAFFGAHESNTTILLAGVATGVAGMVAMTAGQYLSSKAESEVHRSEIERELREIIEHPAEELAELAEIYRLQGMGAEQARDAALAVSKDPNKALEVMARAELGLDTESAGNPLKDAAVMAPSFLLGAIAPILPYVFTNGREALALSISLACLALFGIGIVKARVTNGNPWRSGLEQFLIGAGAGIIGYVVGTFVPSLFGVKFVGG
ncbi:MAG TPA: VIT1/CCC1 transporter family protein [Candidatus Eremiobacteraceae bacterium]|nr:VIT1/CCC1 transporter family protein [Candidatus Eremiobacteraceae bacterium]